MTRIPYHHRSDKQFSLSFVSLNASETREWVDEHIRESKAIATVRRKNVLLKLLRNYGVTEVERRKGVVIELDSYDLDMPPGDAQQRYAELHQNCWINFVENAVERAGRSELKETEGLSKRELAQELRRSE